MRAGVAGPLIAFHGSSRTSTAAIRFTRGNSTRPAFDPATLKFPRDLSQAAAHDQAGAGCRSAGLASVGHQSHRAARALHPLQPDVVDDGEPAALARHERKLAVDARVLEGGLRRGANVDARDRIFFPFSFGPFLGFWTAFEAGCQLGAHCIPAGGMSSQARLALIETLKPTVICCTPTYALRLLEVAAEMRDGKAGSSRRARCGC